MSMLRWNGLGVMLVLVGCGAPAPGTGLRVPPPAAQAVLSSAPPPEHVECDPHTCPNLDEECCKTNGAGVYTAEDGYAGIGEYSLMITHFINNTRPDGTRYVTFQGRYHEVASNKWWSLPTAGSIEYADHTGYANQQLQVSSVSETSTQPRWTLRGTSKAAADIPVTGGDLAKLTLHIKVDVPNLHGETPARTKRYTLQFGGVTAEPGTNFKTVIKYDLSWSEQGSSTSKRYCATPEDPVVFQQGIDVHPVTGRVTPSPSVVTMSCRQGALATVYWWGYDYRGTSDAERFYFESGIQMKRASYCADENYYTTAGTPIVIADDHGIEGWYQDIQTLEARWSPKGAVCLDTMRHPEKNFSRICNSTPVPTCDQVALKGAYLANGLGSSAPSQ